MTNMWRFLLISVAACSWMTGSLAVYGFYSTYPAPTYGYAPGQNYYDYSAQNGYGYGGVSYEYVVNSLISPKERLNHLESIISNCLHPRSLLCRPDPADAYGVGACVDYSKRCNGYYDCPLGDDEKGCVYDDQGGDNTGAEECGPLQIRCCDTQRCANTCDGVSECSYGVDEKDCGTGCPSGQVQCSDGECARICDGESECPGGTDEECGPSSGCLIGQLRCGSICANRCDGVVECGDGSDEICRQDVCQRGTIPCINNIDGAEICAILCDADVECRSGADEDPTFCKLCVWCDDGMNPGECVFEDECPTTDLDITNG